VGKIYPFLKNLITNLGFSGEATHTSNYDKKKKTLKRNELGFPIKGPSRKGDYLKSYLGFFKN